MSFHQLARRLSTHSLWLIVCVIAAIPLWLGPGIIQTRAGGDSPFLLQRTFELAENLRAGVIPARWMPNANFGLGYPFFNFYAALPYYVTAGLNVLGLDLIFSIQLTQTWGMFAAAASMWLLARRCLSQQGATLAAIAYTLAPFHLANLYVRGDSLSEFWAFACFPLVLWGVLHGGKRGWWAVTLGLAALACTHNVSTLLFIPVLGLFCLWQLLRTRNQEPSAKGQDFKSWFLVLKSWFFPLGSWLLTAGAGAMLLSMWFWLPALVGTNSVQLDEQTTGYLNYANHFRGLNLVQSSLLFDYTVDARLGVFGMGLLQAIFSILGLLAWLWQMKTARWLVPALFLFTTILITPLSTPIWQWLKPLQLAQFPWRVLSLQSLFAALLIGKLADGGSPRLYIIAILLSTTMLARLPNQRLWVNAASVTPENLRMFEWFSGNIGSTIRAEYLPKTALPKTVTGPAMLGQAPQAIALSGEISQAQQTSAQANAQQWQITVASPQADLVLPLLYWQAWRANVVTADQISQDLALSANPGSGWVKISLPHGQHHINLWLDKTPDQRWGEWLSLLAVVALGGVGLWQCWRYKRQHLRTLGLMGLGAATLLTLMQSVSVSTLHPTPSAFADLQTLDFDGRPYPHRAPIVWHAPQPSNDPPYILLAATISPSQVRAGEQFTLTLRWQDDRAPAQVQVIQELPSGIANEDLASRIFRYARSVTPANAPSTQHATLPEAPLGPLLLKLAVNDANTRPMSATLATGETLNTFWLLGLNISERSTPAALPPTLRTFANGIRLHDLDWQQQDGEHVCIRPTWSSDRPIADALQVSIRLRNADGGEVATVDGQPHLGLSPTWAWPPNVPIKDSYCHVPIRNHLQAGDAYQIQMIWYRVSDQATVGETSLSGTRLPEMNGWHNPK
jgi:hypothetical protein